MDSRSRTLSWGSGFVSNSFANQAEASKKQSLTTDNYPVYFISREKLKAWLEKTFPETSPYAVNIEKSNYYFQIPRRLTDADRADIKKHHDLSHKPSPKPAAAPRRAVSPGG